MSFKSGVKGRGSDIWWERGWWLWWGDMHRMKWLKNRRLQVIPGILSCKNHQKSLTESRVSG